jgi:hypothetical protein
VNSVSGLVTPQSLQVRSTSFCCVSDPVFCSSHFHSSALDETFLRRVERDTACTLLLAAGLGEAGMAGFGAAI